MAAIGEVRKRQKPEDFEAAEAVRGTNSELLAVRVPLSLMQGLEALAKGSSVPRVVRSLLWYHLTPSLLRQSLRRLSDRELRELSSVQALTRLLEEYRELSQRLDTVAAVVERVRDRAEGASAEVEELARAWTVQLEAVLSELDAEAELLEEPIFSEPEDGEDA